MLESPQVRKVLDACTRDFLGLHRSRQAQLWEAAVFYGARILERGLIAAYTHHTGEETANVYSALLRLEGDCRISPPEVQELHQLRRLGNEARHLFRPLDQVDASDAAFFGLRLADILPPLLDHEDGSWAAEVRQTFPADQETLLAQGGTASRLKLYTQVRSSIASKDWEGARYGLAELKNLPGTQQDLAYLQLEALTLKRFPQAGPDRLTRAVDLLEPASRGRENDPESMGILAGVYKSLHQETGRKAHLHRSRQLYLQCWKKTGDPYPGINAAFTALEAGDPEAARKLSLELQPLLEKRVALLTPRAATHADPLYWTQASLAEALLLAGREEEAELWYARAFALRPDDAGDETTTRSQRDRIRELVSH